MAYLPDAVVPPPTANDEEFWANCDRRRLAFQGCPRCDTVVHPPLPVCPGCQSPERTWIDAPATGRVFSFTWAYTAADDAVRTALPYNIALVEFPDLPGVRLVSNVVNVQPGELAIDDRVALVWESTASGRSLPRFRKP